MNTIHDYTKAEIDQIFRELLAYGLNECENDPETQSEDFLSLDEVFDHNGLDCGVWFYLPFDGKEEIELFARIEFDPNGDNEAFIVCPQSIIDEFMPKAKELIERKFEQFKEDRLTDYLDENQIECSYALESDFFWGMDDFYHRTK